MYELVLTGSEWHCDGLCGDSNEVLTWFSCCVGLTKRFSFQKMFMYDPGCIGLKAIHRDYSNTAGIFQNRYTLGG
jgi:hypothetical protein